MGEYRSLHFHEEFIQEPEDGFFQEAMVVNYPSPDVPFTRIVEYKHVPNQPAAVKRGEVKGTLIAREVSPPWAIHTTRCPTRRTTSCTRSTERSQRKSRASPSSADSRRTSTS